MVDSLRIFDILKAGSIPEPQARAMTQAIQKAETNIGLDVKSVLERELRNSQELIKQQFAAFEERMDRKLIEAKMEILRWNIALWLAQLAAVAGIIKLLK